MKLDDVKWDYFSRVIATRNGIVKNGGAVVRATVKGLFEVEVIAPKCDCDDDYKVVVEFYATEHRNERKQTIGEYSKKKKAIKAIEKFISKFDPSTLNETELEIKASQADPYIKYFKCYCGNSKGGRYIKLPIYSGCICKNFKYGYRPRQSEAEFKMELVKGKYQSVLA